MTPQTRAQIDKDRETVAALVEENKRRARSLTAFNLGGPPRHPRTPGQSQADYCRGCAQICNVMLGDSETCEEYVSDPLKSWTYAPAGGCSWDD